MISRSFRTAGNTQALSHASAALQRMGWKYDDSARILLLPVPSFAADGSLKGGGNIRDFLTADTIVIGGFLSRPELTQHTCVDLLQEPRYLAENAAITAHCSIKYALERLPVILAGCPVLVAGWGRIGKCLAALLRQIGADVSVYARKESDRAMLAALGYRPISTLATDLSGFRAIFNTAPEMLFPEGTLLPHQVKIDLASQPGIGGRDVVWARGLPNQDAPESSGCLIAASVDRLRKEELL